MISNSAIFTSTVFGTSSGLTVEELNQKNITTQELVYKEQVVSKMNNKKPIVPSNQRLAKD